MPRTFISNTKVQEVEGDIVFNSALGIEQLPSVDRSGSTVFVIDVHCTFKAAEKMQQQGGVIIYRHLLKQFDKCQDKLKVVFYSPIPKEALVKLKPENYVLTLLPFVELFPNDDKGNDIPNWAFTSALIEEEKRNCPQFNNASENLLSGWALAGRKKVTTNNKKILFIDDQQSEWKEAFLQLFEENTLQYLKNSKGHFIESQTAYRTKLNANWENFVSLTKNALNHNPNLILSDFYLIENHEISKWKDNSEVRKISGFKLFNEIRLVAPATPYVFHTTSNKASIYKFLDASGADDWLLKDTRVDSSNDEKKENFEAFKHALESFLQTNNYGRIKLLWDLILKVEQPCFRPKINSQLWVENHATIIKLLKSSWIALRRLLNREELFEKNLTELVDFREDAFTTTAICNNLGKVMEILECTNVKTFNKNGKEYTRSRKSSFLIQMRHEASHSNSFEEFRMEDALIYFFVLFATIQDEFQITLSYKFDFHKKSPKESHDFSLFWQYIQLYNKSKNLDPEIRSQIEVRLQQLFNKYKEQTNFQSLLIHDFKLLIREPIPQTTSDIEMKFVNDCCQLCPK